MNKDSLWKKIKISSILSFVFPLLLLIISVIAAKRGFTGLVKNYEEGIARFVQYGLFTIGVGIFFFCDGISDFFARRTFTKREKEPIISYIPYVLFSIWLLNIIAITGFLGFLICGNISWLTVFVILNISMGIRYIPSEKRLEKLIEKTNLKLKN